MTDTPSNDNHGKKPHKNIGDNIRKMIHDHAENAKFKETYLHVLNGIFSQVAGSIADSAVSGFQKIFNQYSATDQNSQDIFMAVKLTTPEKQGGYSPISRMQLPFVTTFTEIEPRDLFTCQGYIDLHKIAREMNVAVSLNYMFTEDTQSNSFGNPPILTIDARFSYDQGMRQQPAIYPDLPPLPKEEPKTQNRKPKAGGSFKL